MRRAERKIDAWIERVEAAIAAHPPLREELSRYAMVDGVQPDQAIESDEDAAPHRAESVDPGAST
jgi:hypothetical protein